MWCHRQGWWRQWECHMGALWRCQQGSERAPFLLGCLAGGSLPGSSKLSGLLDRRWWVLVVLLDCRV